ncbi:MAG: type VI secretion system tip protein TssI/VgrG, partial [Prolixibacteraceae bacterium]
MNIFDMGSKASFLFEVQGTSLSMSVLSFKSQERISSPYLAEVSLASSSEITYENIMQKEALLTLIGLESNRYIHGIVRKFEHIGISGAGTDKENYLYRAEIVPFTQLLSLEQDCRIFQNKNVQDIVADIFKDSGLPADRYEFRLKNKEHRRRFCVQYRETDLDFINRILQEEGIYYFYEHSKDKHLMVFADDPTRHKSIAGNSKITFKPPSGRVPETEVINNIEFSQRLRPGTYSQTNYNFKHVSTPLDTKDKSREVNLQKYEIYDYPGQYGDQDKGKKLTRINREAYNALQEQTIGESNCPRLLPGHTFSLDGYDLDTFDKEYFLIEVTAAGGQAQALEEVSGSGETSYGNNFVAVPSSISYRPKKSIEKPYVKGIQTATVVGPENEEIYVDEHGRVKVQFHWDRKGKKDEQSSCWL